MAHRGEPTGHFNQKDDAYGAENYGPDQLESEGGTRLRRRSHRPDFEETSDTGDDAKRYFQKLLHGFGPKALV
ncbi:hypothetical protein [Mesorhizobium sp. M0052]|uniref:hypothetical protein n=1 Tax=Mesorhizobium sp. M0052 TaxID=2956863 RepID=UPI003339D68A